MMMNSFSFFLSGKLFICPSILNDSLKNEKGLMNMDNSVAIAVGEEGIRELSGNGKKHNKDKNAIYIY